MSEYCVNCEAMAKRAEAAEQQLEWIKHKIRTGWSGYRKTHDEESLDIKASMHVLASHAHGYEAYIAAGKCEEPAGEIARLGVRAEQLQRDNEKLAAVVREVAKEQGVPDGYYGPGVLWYRLTRAEFDRLIGGGT